jgi:acetyl-CoA carboxylase carboxyl transferase subunit beta
VKGRNHRMPISDWFSAREQRRYTKMQEDRPESSEVADGAWVRCESCKRIAYEGELAENLRVCKHCGHHLALTAPERIELLADEGSFAETDADLMPCDPLEFVGRRAYVDTLASAVEKSGLPEAVVTGTAKLDGRPVVLVAMDFRFIGASMGSVVGEKVTRAFELATEGSKPIIVVTASGGARMQEGMLSLMQMAKTSAAARRHADARLPYIAILSDPTYGGVTASFATLADITIAEPGARIGFAGPDVIEQTIRQRLPKGFQTAESLVEHGMIDEVVHRKDLRDCVASFLGYLCEYAEEGGAA